MNGNADHGPSPSGSGDKEAPLLAVEGLRCEFRTPAGRATAVHDLSFSLHEGEVLALVGESGSGKSVTALSLLGLLPDPPGRITAGRILYRGRDLRALSRAALNRLRGSEIAMIFQDPMTSLDPAFTVGDQMTEVLRQHEKVSPRAARERAVQMLARVHIPEPATRLEAFPFQLSGGLRQRVMIAMALLCGPSLLLADEPTTALDVTVQAQILRLLRELREEYRLALLLITHDFGVVRQVADEVMVLYAGHLLERAPADELFRAPAHPYTRDLLAARPDPSGERRLAPIPGLPPNLTHPLPGCPYANRCGEAGDDCWADRPAAHLVSAHHAVRCFRAGSPPLRP